jgi:hypothetical protein
MYIENISKIHENPGIHLMLQGDGEGCGLHIQINAVSKQKDRANIYKFPARGVLILRAESVYLE